MSTRTCLVIVTFNSMEFIERLALSIREFVDLTKDAVVFVDNGSTDSTVAAIEGAFTGCDAVRVIRNTENAGFSRANNTGMRAVDADCYMLLNHDTYLVNDVITEVLSYYPDGTGPDIVGPSLVYPDFSYQSSAYPFSSPLKSLLQETGIKSVVHGLARSTSGVALLKALSLIPVCRPYITGLLSGGAAPAGGGRARMRERVDWVTGACMMVSRRVFEETGGFDERIFMYGEDEELCFRARGMGFDVERVNAGPVVHYMGWGRNRTDEQLSPAIYDSMVYVVDKNFRERPVQRLIMRMMLSRRFKRTL